MTKNSSGNSRHSKQHGKRWEQRGWGSGKEAMTAAVLATRFLCERRRNETAAAPRLTNDAPHVLRQSLIYIVLKTTGQPCQTF